MYGENLMKKCSSAILLVLAASLAVNPVLAQNNAEAGFEKIKSLAGDWQGVKPDGQAVGVSYEVMSNGSAVVETLKPANEPTMVTVYHIDGDKLMMTHYCSAGNQPRMVAEISGNEVEQIHFDFVDATNLIDRSEGHMKNLSILFLDKDHINQKWTWSKAGKSMPATFEFTRKKKGSG